MKSLKALLTALLVGVIACSSSTKQKKDSKIRYIVEDMSEEPIQTQPPAQKKIEYTGDMGQPVIVRSASAVWSETIETTSKQDVKLTATVIADSLINMRVSIYKNNQLQNSKIHEAVRSLTVQASL